ncbi:bifunctional 3'-5' exonuclease/ATP-dependent helicase WRN isoform X3 [Erythrolamprus reginae]|uniref:bifunctional 3'-5' exonuclease/ATP-dependent helicase WRN isoform X3 n=1 Tax=Erythrolamprus reginae TaxID=121349 RepID=UPI00396CBCF2
MDSPPNKLPLWMTEPNNEDIVDDKKQKNSFQSSVLEDNLPFLEYNGSIIYSYNANDCSLLSEDILISLPVGAVLGFDIEWPAIYAKGKEGKVALIQLCESETKCYLFHISSMTGFPAGLKRLLEDNSIRKAGVGIKGDKWKLMRDFEIKLENLVDLGDLANEKLKCKEIWSLNGLVKHLFHKQLVKDKSVRCGNWECFPLTEEQKVYAATDAYVGFLIYQNLINLSKDKQMHICLKTGGMLLPSEIKNELTSLSKVVLDLANCVPATFHQSTHIQSATEILADISKNIKALRDILLLKSNCEMELEKTAEGVSKLTSKMICQSDHDIDDKTAGVQNSHIKNEDKRGKKAHTVDASDIIFKTSTEKEFLMSLDVTEYELQMMERQAEEEMQLEAACMLEDLQSIEDDHSAMENDYEFEMEMLKSLEDTNQSNLNSNPRSLEKQGDHVAEDEGEEGIEEEEESWDSSLPKPSSEQIACLKMYFGHSNFKPVQWKVISSVLQERRDNLVVMATGYGKSLCFQFPPVYTGGTGIVISPLISLMEDQVRQLEMSGIPACLLGSAQSKNVREEIKAGQYRVVYLTPEFCSGNLLWLQQIDKAIGITLIAVDEAHCISEWGHDFRNSFRSLGLLKKTLPKVPIVALTATASSSIRKDIIDCLNLRTPYITCTSFDRPNLYLEVRRKSGNMSQDLLQFLIQKDRSTYEFEGPTIVYCPSRKTTEQVAAELRKLNLVCGIYHAGMGVKARRDVHHKFMRDEIQCIVATIAFGMGINKADIRTVIHYGAPKEMESYYQEIGRAGRDGLPASCYALWTQADMSFNRHLISEIRNEKFRLYKLKMMAKIERYLSLNSCRRRIILSHFEDKQLRKASTGIMGTEKCCDNCRASSRDIHCAPIIDPQDSFEDFGQQAYKLMSAVCALKERFGMGAPILLLRGSYSQRLPDKFRTDALFGSGKDWPEHSWKALGRRLMLEGFLKEVSGQNKFAVMCMLTEKGKDWLTKSRKEQRQSLLLPSDEELCLKKPTPRNKQISVEAGHTSNAGLPLSTLRKQNTSLHEMFSYSKVNKMSSQSIPPDKSSAAVQLPLPCTSLSDAETVISERQKELQTLLYGRLVAARQKLANEKDIPPAVLATNKVLVDMTLIRPTTVEIMKKIDGISEAKSTVLAPLLNIIKEFSQANNLQTDIFKNSGVRDPPDVQLNSQYKTRTESEERKTYSLSQDKSMSKEDSVKPLIQKSNSESCGNIKQNASCSDSLSWIQCNKEEQVLNPKQDVQNTHQSAIKLASWNQNSADVEEDLFTDSQLELLSQPSKRKLPEWFGTSKETIPPVKVSKKSKGGSKGLFS